MNFKKLIRQYYLHSRPHSGALKRPAANTKPVDEDQLNNPVIGLNSDLWDNSPPNPSEGGTLPVSPPFGGLGGLYDPQIGTGVRIFSKGYYRIKFLIFINGLRSLVSVRF